MPAFKPVTIDSDGDASDVASGDFLDPSHGGTGEITLTAAIVALLTALDSGGDAGQVLQSDGAGGYAWVDPVTTAEGGGFLPMIAIDDATDFGAGGDGAVTATTATITADINATTYLVPAGVTVTVGWVAAESRPARIRATTSITNLGKIKADGSDGGLPSGGTGGAGGVSLTGGGGGGGGATTTGGAAGTTGRTSANGAAGTGGGGYGGGAGGAGSSSRKPKIFGAKDLGFVSTCLDLSGRGGDGGNGASGGTGGGGGGGGGGGISLMAPIIRSTGTISTKGGNGANAGHATCDGGGGGEAGGVLLVGREVLFHKVECIGGTPGGVGTTEGPGHGGPGFVILVAESSPIVENLVASNIIHLPVIPL